ncbi:hypothetical protein ACRN98_05460 [Shewanella oncorhynchi]|uniref:hypothetical protein n=1 Tax=Shewanella oncorhynchi TaxID=2726434 RepID=UPI003D79ADC5
MTGTYEWNPMPHQVDVRCPTCEEYALFEFAEIVKISKKEDVAFFQESNQFVYGRFQDSCGHYWHAAIYFAGLHGSPEMALINLPEGYMPTDWQHSKYMHRRHRSDLGSVSCRHCGNRFVHNLRWPLDAYYAISYKGKELWAFNRDSAIELRDFIESKSRNISKYQWSNFLLHVPSIFKSHKARGEVTKLINRLLKSV